MLHNYSPDGLICMWPKRTENLTNNSGVIKALLSSKSTACRGTIDGALLKEHCQRSAVAKNKVIYVQTRKFLLHSVVPPSVQLHLRGGSSTAWLA